MSQPDAVPPPLARLPQEAREAYRRFLKEADFNALDRVLDAVLLDLAPKKPGQTITFTEDSRLLEDVGYDSLAVAELVFLLEDTFKMSVSNEEILAIRKVSDLRAFMRTKLADFRPAS